MSLDGLFFSCSFLNVLSILFLLMDDLGFRQTVLPLVGLVGLTVVEFFLHLFIMLQKKLRI